MKLFFLGSPNCMGGNHSRNNKQMHLSYTSQYLKHLQVINFCFAVLFVYHRLLFDNNLNPALEFQILKELWLHSTNHTCWTHGCCFTHAQIYQFVLYSLQLPTIYVGTSSLHAVCCLLSPSLPKSGKKEQKGKTPKGNLHVI